MEYLPQDLAQDTLEFNWVIVPPMTQEALFCFSISPGEQCHLLHWYPNTATSCLSKN